MARPVFIVDGSRTPFLKARSGPGPFTPVDLAVQVIVGGPRDRDVTRLAELLQPGGDVDPIAEQITVRLDHHVAEVDPDPQHDPALVRHAGLPLGHGPLQGGLLLMRRYAPEALVPQATYVLELIADGVTILLFAIGVFDTIARPVDM